MESYPIDFMMFFLGDIVPSQRMLHGAKELENQAAIGGGLLKNRVKKTNIVAKIIESMV
jgi:hypothetical protein